MNKIVRNFIQSALMEMIDHKIAIHLTRTRQIFYEGEKIPCGGYFTGTYKTFGCAVGGATNWWISVFIHEYNHFRQWIEKEPLFMKAEEEANDMFWTWLEKERELTPKQINEYTNIVRDMELDCEKRSVKCIKKNKLEKVVNIENYIKKANVYILFYEHIKHNRKWYKKISPCRIPELIENASPIFMKDYTKLPDWFLKHIDKCL